MKETIDRYKQDMMSLHDKNRDRIKLQQFTESIEEETPTPEQVTCGTLKVFVCEENSAPIPCSYVMVSSFIDDNREELNFYVRTDEFGSTGALLLPTNRTYTVKVTAEGYTPVTLSCVKVSQCEINEQTVILSREDLIYDKAPLALNIVRKVINRNELALQCTFPIRLGDCGECVKNLQERIAILSRVFDSLTPPRISGNYGNNTAAAVGKLQRIFSLPVDYCVDRLTWECIYSASDVVYDETECDKTAKMCIEFPKNKILAKCDKNEDVFFLQLSILKIGKRFVNITPICINGIYDDATEQNVLTLQKIFSLPATGRVGNATMSKILKLQADAI